MIRLPIKALSLNHAYRGRRFATTELKQYKHDLGYLLSEKTLKIDSGAKLEAHYIFGVSSKNCDADNLIKALQDFLAETYGFNDRNIYKITAEKRDVKKGCEFVSFEINSLESITNGERVMVKVYE